MISYEEAKAILLQAGQEKGCDTEYCSLLESLGQVCAQDVSAPLDIQPFDNSAMDGFAIRREDLALATESSFVSLNCCGIIAAGDAMPDRPLEVGTCMEIMTGAPVPLGADAVIPVERVQINEKQVFFKEIPQDGDHIRRAGEDFKKDMPVLKAGQRLRAQHIMPLAALGVDRLNIYKKPRVVFLATGKELVDDLSKELKTGQIYNSNRPYGLAVLKSMGVKCESAPTIPDDVRGFKSLLQSYMDQGIDLIISSGAVSAGKFDFVRKGLEDMGAEILFHKVKIRPGKPNLFARLPNGTLYFGLPGNPAATAVGLRFFVQPCIRAMMGVEPEEPIRARLASDFTKKPGFQIVLKAHASVNKEACYEVELYKGQASFMVHPFLEMNCWSIVPENQEKMNAGDLVEIYPLL